MTGMLARYRVCKSPFRKTTDSKAVKIGVNVLQHVSMVTLTRLLHMALNGYFATEFKSTQYTSTIHDRLDSCHLSEFHDPHDATAPKSTTATMYSQAVIASGVYFTRDGF
eukprot:CAMPEP_0114294776 /NCGR_PEP_ID=MMETSP0059-20121206/10315_1 /TAXON_ID=36894 /ORGANISM="Pyramimonas parkeae, Strain CCMP726" /LENGTH=109 /DNA_ID=CAMNT_0001416593 /DNA_START=73 /DNA_END=402 /DNA_ORIENTATION=+